MTIEEAGKFSVRPMFGDFPKKPEGYLTIRQWLFQEMVPTIEIKDLQYYKFDRDKGYPYVSPEDVRPFESGEKERLLVVMPKYLDKEGQAKKEEQKRIRQEKKVENENKRKEKEAINYIKEVITSNNHQDTNHETIDEILKKLDSLKDLKISKEPKNFIEINIKIEENQLKKLQQIYDKYPDKKECYVFNALLENALKFIQ